MSQLNLVTVDPKQAKFERYHAENPEIWEEFKKLCFDLIRAGRRHYSADGILHAIRFNTAIRGSEMRKIDNNYSSMYSRMFTANYPEHTGFFEQRILKTK
jgi:hypothetical protein